MKYDPSSGAPFYVHHATKTTQWEPPTNLPAVAAVTAPKFCSGEIVCAPRVRAWSKIVTPYTHMHTHTHTCTHIHTHTHTYAHIHVRLA